ncbi:DUF4097 family beta strand repeat-containing protein [Glycomyces buryatensis]|uniref:DUF4097 domain-containing protein n=1 Tax=Glycomyces buryatensis TaxID=2570927 RepID=A0A4S8Q8U9_9ACTN|nr:DUF4097 family beta strand repeat-containing protein [Glycomyces buryatensis]THV39831.1 DUF4097 domain-containing protein [Glycomyces buryatensis]
MATFNTPGPISATVDIILGDIRFNASDRADTVVEVHPIDPSRQLDVEAAADVVVEFADGRLRVSHPRLRTLFTKKYGSVRVLVALPTGSEVQGDTAQGEYLVQGAVGTCRLKTAIGDIRVAQAVDVRLRTTGGKVIVDHVSGEADVKGNGDIRIRRIDGTAQVRNIGGDIRIAQFGGDTVDLNSATGGLSIGIAAGGAVELDARATVGDVRDYLAAAGAPERSDRIVKVRARCHAGDIVVHRAGAGHDAPQRSSRFQGWR